MRRVLTSPAFHFLVLGAALLAADRGFFSRAPQMPAERAPIEIDASRDEAGIDDEILLAEARARGLERRDPVVRARLARNLAFLAPEALAGTGAGRAGDAARVDEALALGLARGDLVVRRRLLERMRAELSVGEGRAATEAEIAARFVRDAVRFTRPERVRISHVFLSRDQRGAGTDADAERLRARMVGESLALQDAIACGDPFLLGHVLPPRSQIDLARDFGEAFARAAFALEPGVVSSAIASSYGVHLLVVDERWPAAPASLESARAEIAAELQTEHDAATLRAAIAGLRARYEIIAAQVEP